jgi:hypothetical protein
MGRNGSVQINAVVIMRSDKEDISHDGTVVLSGKVIHE